jgi:hypothetical protein
MILEIVQFVKRLSQVQQHELCIVVTHFIQPVFQSGSHEACIAQTADMIFVIELHRLDSFLFHRLDVGGRGRS